MLFGGPGGWFVVIASVAWWFGLAACVMWVFVDCEVCLVGDFVVLLGIVVIGLLVGLLILGGVGYL